MLEAKFISNDRKDVWIPLHPNILPGKAGAWEDRSTGAIRFILAHCMEDNSGGTVHILETDDTRWQDQFLVAQLSEDNRVFEIYGGHRCELEIVDCDGDEGLLIIQHIGHKGLIQKYN